MTRIIFAFFISSIAICVQSNAVAQINFIPVSSLEDIRPDKKIVYINFYTEWSVPCEIMEKECFSDSTISDFCNTTFYNLRLNAEEGIGKVLAARFNVKAHPTSLFLTDELKEIYRMSGYMGKTSFLYRAIEVAEYTMLRAYSPMLRKDSIPALIAKYKHIGLNIQPRVQEYYEQMQPHNLLQKDSLQLFLELLPYIDADQEIYRYFITQLPKLEINSVFPDTSSHYKIKQLDQIANPVLNKINKAELENDIDRFNSGIEQYQTIRKTLFENDTSVNQKWLLLTMVDFYTKQPSPFLLKPYMLDDLMKIVPHNMDNYIDEYRTKYLDNMLLYIDTTKKIYEKSQHIGGIVESHTMPLLNYIRNYEIIVKGYKKLGITNLNTTRAESCLDALNKEYERVKQLVSEEFNR